MGEDDNMRELEPLAEAEKAVSLQKIAQLHRNTGHGPVEHLVKALEARHTDPRVVALAREFVCPVCQELSRQVPSKFPSNHFPQNGK